jgi:hypothetical protein
MDGVHTLLQAESSRPFPKLTESFLAIFKDCNTSTQVYFVYRFYDSAGLTSWCVNLQRSGRH